MMGDDMLRAIEARTAEREAFLAALVRQPSDNPPGDCTPHAVMTRELIEVLGFTVESHAVLDELCRAHGMTSAINLVVRRRFGDGPVLALNAHGDVVPPGEGWSRDPYGAEVHAGWSRGEARWLGPYGHHSVSSPRSSNRTCGFPASGFPTGFTSKHTAVGQDGPDFVGSHRAPRTRPYRGNLVPRDDTLWRLTRK